jgi:hypothetical protein
VPAKTARRLNFLDNDLRDIRFLPAASCLQTPTLPSPLPATALQGIIGEAF